MLLSRYARKNLRRQPGRSLLTITAVTLAVGLIIIGTTLVDGFFGHVMEEFAVNTGHVRLRHPEYDRKSRFEPLDFAVGDVTLRTAQLERAPVVRRVLPRLRFGIMLQHTDTSTIVPESAAVDEHELTDEQIFGKKIVELSSASAVDPQRELDYSRVPGQLVSGTWLSGGDVLLGVDLAARLNTKVGDTLEVVSFKDGLRDASARVAGIFDSGNKMLNRTAYLPLRDAQALLGMPDAATELLVFGAELEDSPGLLRAVRASPGATNLSAAEWSAIGLMKTVTGLFGVIFGALALAILVVAVSGLLNTMLMNVLERRREIGVLLALGMARRHVIFAIVLEAAFLALVGAVLGVALGLLGGLYLERHGIEIGERAAANLPVAVGSVMHGKLTTFGVLRAVVLGLFTAMLGALWPAWRASSLSPIEAMRRR
jgi:putative ABC transport system permease protein